MSAIDVRALQTWLDAGGRRYAGHAPDSLFWVEIDAAGNEHRGSLLWFGVYNLMADAGLDWTTTWGLATQTPAAVAAALRQLGHPGAAAAYTT